MIVYIGKKIVGLLALKLSLDLHDVNAQEMMFLPEHAALTHDLSILKRNAAFSHEIPPSECDPSASKLDFYQQWRDEEGYWIGDYSFYNSNGDPYTSENWNYPYDHYKGFITGNIESSSYRQRNVFLYPPQKSTKCPSKTAVGTGECGINGNTKVFYADQSASTCNANGNIQGPFGLYFHTTTELIGANNALLYQVWLKKELFNLEKDLLYQSQLTTITGDGNHRTRTAQGFEVFNPTNIGAQTYSSFYREQKVKKDKFYEELQNSLNEYSILESDMCAWENGATGNAESAPYTPGIKGCKTHLESTFDLTSLCKDSFVPFKTKINKEKMSCKDIRPNKLLYLCEEKAKVKGIKKRIKEICPRACGICS